MTSLTSARARRAASAPASYRDAGQQVFAAIGDFLAEHRLPPTPSNYRLSHAVITGSDPTIAHAVATATDGDIRLSQAEADAILARVPAGPVVAGSAAGAVTAGASVADLARAIDEARDRFERYAGIVDNSRADAQAYGNALVDQAATLEPDRPAATGNTIEALLALTESMVAKTRAAEEQLRAASVEMQDLRENLAMARQDAETDPLTGLPNRRAFEASFGQAMAGAGQGPHALALCDIDHFKGVNDLHGHDVGDRVLRLVARELEQGCTNGMVARYGGEEFAILFAGCEMTAAGVALDQTRELLSSRSFKVAGTGATLENLSFSGGLVAVAAGEDVRGAVKRADGALYRAKQAGRNRIERG